MSPAAGRGTLAEYFAAFGPGPPWEEVSTWPPDVFALGNLVLDHTEGYRFVVAPPRGARWPPLVDWNARTAAAAEAWRRAAARPGAPLPPLVRRCWELVSRGRGAPLAQIRCGEAWELTAALLTLHAIADEACARVAAGARGSTSSFEGRARRLLERQGSLARLSPARVRVVPKTHFSGRGITIRSLSRHLALSYESVDIRWRSRDAGRRIDRRRHTLLLLPWPLTVTARDFRPAQTAALGNMDAGRFGFFEFVPHAALDHDALASVLATATEAHGTVDAVVLPEAAVPSSEIPRLERTLAEHGAGVLIAGVRAPATVSRFGRNYLHFGLRNGARWSRYEQDKHHRWCLDESQIRQYHLSRSLDPRRQWWEAIDIQERALHVIDLGGGVTTAPLVCEDLARLDEVAALVRTIGPSLVLALLLDGPQLEHRWPCRYASLVADDPGSAVLTLTSSGMAARSRPPGTPRSRVIAHWNGPGEGIREIELKPRALAVLLTAAVDGTTLWTADGRRHPDVPRIRLAAVDQIVPPPRGSDRRGRGRARSSARSERWRASALA